MLITGPSPHQCSININPNYEEKEGKEEGKEERRRVRGKKRDEKKDG